MAERLRERDGHQLFNRKVRLVDLSRIPQVHLPLNLRQAAVVSAEKQVRWADRTAPVLPADFVVEHLTEQETAALSHIAATRSAMLNDLLIRDYFLTLAEWNRGTSEAHRPLRILVPTNMRRREDLQMPAANIFSYAFLTRGARDAQNAVQLLASIRDEMKAIKHIKRGLYYEAGVRLFCMRPSLLRWSLDRKWAFATAVFTNLGAVFDHMPLPTRQGRKVAGNLVFESGAAPDRFALARILHSRHLSMPDDLQLVLAATHGR